MKVPPIHFYRIFHEINHSFWGSPIYEPPFVFGSAKLSDQAPSVPPWEKQCGVTWLLSVLRRNLWGVKHCKTPDIPSSKRLHNYGKSPFWKNVLYNYFDWAIFNSKLLVYQRVNQPRGVKHQQPPQSGYHCKKAPKVWVCLKTRDLPVFETPPNFSEYYHMKLE